MARVELGSSGVSVSRIGRGSSNVGARVDPAAARAFVEATLVATTPSIRTVIAAPTGKHVRANAAPTSWRSSVERLADFAAT